MQQKHPADVAIVFRHEPIDAIHPFARVAAQAAECANAQQRFFPFAAQLFRHQSDMGELTWSDVARAAGVPDTITFNRCIADGRSTHRILEDEAAARSLAVTGTPTVLINNLRFTGNIPLASLDSMVTERLSRRDGR